jgi:hypothetical protein
LLNSTKINPTKKLSILNFYDPKIQKFYESIKNLIALKNLQTNLKPKQPERKRFNKSDNWKNWITRNHVEKRDSNLKKIQLNHFIRNSKIQRENLTSCFLGPHNQKCGICRANPNDSKKLIANFL